MDNQGMNLSDEEIAALKHHFFTIGWINRKNNPHYDTLIKLIDKVDKHASNLETPRK